MSRSLTESEFRVVLRRAVARAGSQAQFAKETGLSPSFLCDVLLGRRGMTPRITSLLGYRKRVVYEAVTGNTAKDSAG
jgi:DNA-binding transcriptional regulator YdaS (Cro superfamily)